MKRTTLKFKFRPLRGRPGEGVLVIHLTYNRKTPTSTTPYILKQQEWDEQLQQVIAHRDTSDPRKNHLKRIQMKMNRDRKTIEKEIKRLQDNGTLTADAVLNAFKHSMQYLSLSAFIAKIAEELRKKEQFSTARWYTNAGKSFIAFREGKDIHLNQLNESIIAEYEKHLSRRLLKKNTVSNYMRALRATYNTAVRERVIKEKQTHPFKHAFTGNDSTNKLAIEKMHFQQMHQIEIAPDIKQLFLPRDMMLFSFFAQGMNFKDIAYLKKENIQRGFIIYKRQKTSQWIRVKIEPCIQEIIDRYATETKESAFVFPILQNNPNPENVWKQYQSALCKHNRMLKKLARMIGLEVRLTSYVARHSWATAASCEGIALSTISRGLGHESIQTTKIYVADTDTSDVVFANQKLLAIFQETG